jgi:LacI family transcriptional regulator
VGFLIGDISNPLFADIALGSELALHDAHHAMLIANSLGAASDDAEQLSLLRQRRVDGFLLSLSDEAHPGTIGQLKSLGKPFVLIDREVQAVPSAAVLSDHAYGIRAAAAHLIELGHRRIGLIAGGRTVLPTYARADALLAACAAHRGVRALVEYGTYSAAHGEATAEAFLSQRDPPTALIAGGNQILAGVLRVIRRRRLRIPKDLSLITCDRTPLAEFLEPALATIERDPRELGHGAAQLLLEVLRGAAPRRVLLPVRFVPGRSCGPPP